MIGVKELRVGVGRGGEDAGVGEAARKRFSGAKGGVREGGGGEGGR